MLPSRLFKNLGIPPPLRSLVVIHPALSPSVAVQLRFRLRLSPQYLPSSASSSRRLHSSPTRASGPSAPISAPARTEDQIISERPPEPRLSLTFTCTANECSERSTHEFTKRAYERGIVIVTCPKCKNRHLIADHIGWFKQTEGTSDGQLKTVEDLMRAKGEKVVRGRLGAGGVVEYAE